MRVALLTCANLPDPDPDETPLLRAFQRAGHDATPEIWDHPTTDWTGFDALLLRSPWDYSRKADAFRAWIDRPEVRARIVNPCEAVRWNLHKGYLLELEANGVAIVPTEIIPRGGPADLDPIVRGRGWDDFVVKPAVSAGSARTKRFTIEQIAAANTFMAEWLGGVDGMVQPYLPSVEGGSHGARERAIVCIGGVVTHVVEKSRRFAGDHESVRARAGVSAEEEGFARRALSACGHRVMYARVDVMSGPAGEMLLGELELIEPSLFFDLGPGSADAYVRAAERWTAERPA